MAWKLVGSWDVMALYISREMIQWCAYLDTEDDKIMPLASTYGCQGSCYETMPHDAN